MTKRITALALALALALLALAGCGIKSNLAAEDFNVYQGGQAVFTPADFYNRDFLFDGNDTFEPEAITTLRGIGIGATAQQVAQAYKDVYCSIDSDTFTTEEYEKYAGVKDLGKTLESIGQLDDYWVYFEMWLVDGRVEYDSQKMLRDAMDDVLLKHEQCQWYTLAFAIQDGQVRNVLLSMLDFVDDGFSY